jgi:photosystem II stability/assembly factor-like uncharacterized protein
MSKKQTSKNISKGPVAVLIGTRKGAFILRGDASRRTWKLSDPMFLGQIIHHLVLDPRDGKTLLAATSTGHLGPTLHRSTNFGKTWEESPRPPAFPKKEDGSGKVVNHTFWLTPGHASQRDVWYAGSSPQGLFRSEDGGKTWDGVAGFNEHPMRDTWCGGGQDGTPDGPKMHSINIDPRDPNHIYIGMSGGGVFESTDGGRDWKPLNKGCAAEFIPTPDPEFGHDPHNLQLHPLMPDRLYQQNHCGIYKMDRPQGVWERIGKNMPKKVGDIGFPIVLHPRDPETVWVFPMDGGTVWPRTSPEGKPAAYVSRNGGNSWKRLDGGLPKSAWYTVKRQAMAADQHNPVGLYFGTTSGELWATRNEGEKWAPVASHLPEIYSVEVAELKR